jgi:EmrB/QacA subfamily drug resistance transporter
MVDVNLTCPPHAVPPSVHLRTAQGRWLLAATVLGSGLAAVDATVVNIALPDIGRDLSAGFATLQWTVTSYTLTLASLILLGGSLGDRFGRRRIFLVGVVWFTAASVLCAVAPGAVWLVTARALQGVGGALMTPASLAIIEASYDEDDRSRAVGAWAGFGALATAVAPFVGGYLLEVGSWRLVFLVNVPLAAVVAWLTVRHVPETSDPFAPDGLDVPGVLLCVAGLGGVTYALISAPDRGADLLVVGAAVVGVLALVCFWFVERHARYPMLPLSLFASRQFSAANLVTLLMYAAISGALFLLIVELQVVVGFSPLVAGSALLPITLLVLLFSARSGALAQRIGPRLQMTLGPVVFAAGLLLTLRLGTDATYVADVLPAVLLLGAGLVLLVAPLTATVLASAPLEHVGVASGVNNAVARAAGLIAVAALPAVSGITGTVYTDPSAFLDGFRIAMVVCVGLSVAAAVVSAALIRRPDPAG